MNIEQNKHNLKQSQKKCQSMHEPNVSGTSNPPAVKLDDGIAGWLIQESSESKKR